MYDAIIIGARCAGSPTAMLLARKGYRVLLVDKARFPSDTLSTHMIWARGVEALGRWGLLDRLVATGCPPLGRQMTVDFGPFALKGSIGADRAAYCPRRIILDKLLVDAAVDSGAEFREAFAVDELVWEDGAVAGIRGHSRRRGSVEERARIVIGADGVNSLVARSVDALEYNAQPPLVTFYYSYFSGFEAEDVEQYMPEHHWLTCFPTHDGLTMIAGGWESRRFHEVRADVAGNIAKIFEMAPSVAERLRSAKREEKWYGTAGVPNYFRKPYGPGWALVGDAAYERDPVTAQGISDAFADADSLANAIDDGFAERRPLAEALAGLEAARNKRVTGMYNFTCQLGTLRPIPPAMMQVYAAMERNPEATSLFFSAVTGSVPVSRFMNAENIGKILSATPA